jgi:ABC-type nitrate/sulfonate/bicarbonate transport system substrate-binding protein
VKAFVEAPKEAADFINEKPAEAARIYVISEKAKSTPEQMLEIMKQEGLRDSMTPTGSSA